MRRWKFLVLYTSATYKRYSVKAKGQREALRKLLDALEDFEVAEVVYEGSEKPDEYEVVA